MYIELIKSFMNNPRINFIIISDVSRSQPRLEANEILNEVLLKDTLIEKEMGIHSRARPTITSLVVNFKIWIMKLKRASV